MICSIPYPNSKVRKTRARSDFESKFVKNDTGAVWPEVEIGDERRLIASVSKALLEGYNLKRSGGEIRQLITQGAVQLDGEKFDDVKGNLPQDVKGKLLRLDKKRSVRFL